MKKKINTFNPFQLPTYSTKEMTNFMVELSEAKIDTLCDNLVKRAPKWEADGTCSKPFVLWQEFRKLYKDIETQHATIKHFLDSMGKLYKNYQDKHTKKEVVNALKELNKDTAARKAWQNFAMKTEHITLSEPLLLFQALHKFIYSKPGGMMQYNVLQRTQIALNRLNQEHGTTAKKLGEKILRQHGDNIAKHKNINYNVEAIQKGLEVADKLATNGTCTLKELCATLHRCHSLLAHLTEHIEGILPEGNEDIKLFQEYQKCLYDVVNHFSYQKAY